MSAPYPGPERLDGLPRAGRPRKSHRSPGCTSTRASCIGAADSVPAAQGVNVNKTIVMTLETRKPRNPFVVASLRRKAGAHRLAGGAARRQARAALRREVDRLKPSP